MEWNRKNCILAVAVVLLCGTGISVFSTPRYEVYYACDKSFHVCTKSAGCISRVSLTVGNTGTQTQDVVQVYLRSTLPDDLLLPLTVQNHDKVPRTYTSETTEDAFVVRLSNVLPNDSVVFGLTTNDQKVSDDDLCEYFLQKIEPTQGPVRKGLPEIVRFLRFLYFAFS